MDENQIATVVVDCAVAVHRRLGPGLMESVYEVVLAHELGKRGRTAERQCTIPIVYDDHRFEGAFRADIIVDQKVIIEIKSVATIHDIHRKQLLTYLRLTDKRLGLLLNFNGSLMKNGIFRIVNRAQEDRRFRRFGSSDI